LAGRLGAALVLGGAIGLERELTGQVAGLRTHMSVALGAALFGIVSAYGWSEFAAVRAQTNVQVDVTRVASNIVTGVGFLGGGAILKDGATVRGLTTAASLWVTAAVGLAVALGGYSLAAVTTIALVFSLILLRGPRGWIRRRRLAELAELDGRATTSVLLAVALVGGAMVLLGDRFATDPGYALARVARAGPHVAACVADESLRLIDTDRERCHPGEVTLTDRTQTPVAACVPQR
jgi:putative Mg2+ transporter-C (MgtC) family protein